MATYKLPNGFRVTVQRVGNDMEFTTRNAERDVISTVQHPYAEAVPLIQRMSALDNLRFAAVYAGGVR